MVTAGKQYLVVLLMYCSQSRENCSDVVETKIKFLWLGVSVQATSEAGDNTLIQAATIASFFCIDPLELKTKNLKTFCALKEDVSSVIPALF